MAKIYPVMLQKLHADRLSAVTISQRSRDWVPNTTFWKSSPGKLFYFYYLLSVKERWRKNEHSTCLVFLTGRSNGDIFWCVKLARRGPIVSTVKPSEKAFLHGASDLIEAFTPRSTLGKQTSNFLLLLLVCLVPASLHGKPILQVENVAVGLQSMMRGRFWGCSMEHYTMPFLICMRNEPYILSPISTKSHCSPHYTLAHLRVHLSKPPANLLSTYIHSQPDYAFWWD